MGAAIEATALSLSCPVVMNPIARASFPDAAPDSESRRQSAVAVSAIDGSILKGGTGNDSYVYNTGDGQDTIIDSDGKSTLWINNQALPITPISFSGTPNLWSSNGTQYQYSSTSPTNKTLTMTGDTLGPNGSGSITIQNFDLNQAQTEDGYLGIHLGSRKVAIETGAAQNTNPFALGNFSPSDVVTSLEQGALRVFTVFASAVSDKAQTVQVALTGAAQYFGINAGAELLPFAAGPVTLIIPAGQTSVTVALVNTGKGAQTAPLQLTANLADANGTPLGGSWSNAFTVNYTADADTTTQPDYTYTGDLNYLEGSASDASGNVVRDPNSPAPGANDFIWGSLGNDLIHTGDGNNVVISAEDFFSLWGNLAGNGTVVGHDTIIGGNGNDMLLGGAANLIAGGGGQDILMGGPGNDRLYANAETDTASAIAFGAQGIATGQTGDLICGGDGNNTLVGGTGNDILSVGNGNSLLIGGPGNTVFFGAAIGPNSDVSSFSVFAGGGITDSTSRLPQLRTSWGTWNIQTVQTDASHWSVDFAGITTPPSPSDALAAKTGSDTMFGGKGNDTFFGGGGGNYIDAGAGNDLVFTGVGNDTVLGGNGNDTLMGAGGDDYLNGEGGNNLIVGGSGNNTVLGGSGNVLCGEAANNAWFSATTSEVLLRKAA